MQMLQGLYQEKNPGVYEMLRRWGIRYVLADGIRPGKYRSFACCAVDTI
jgi:hypothetical protein